MILFRFGFFSYPIKNITKPFIICHGLEKALYGVREKPLFKSFITQNI